MEQEYRKLNRRLEQMGYADAAMLLDDVIYSLVRDGLIPHHIEINGRKSYLMGNTNSEFFAQKRNGPFLELDLLQEVMNDKSADYSRSAYALWSSEHIMQFGSDSIAHLCLPVQVFNALRHDGYNSIEQLEQIVNEGKLRANRISEKGESVIKFAIQEFRSLQIQQEE